MCCALSKRYGGADPQGSMVVEDTKRRFVIDMFVHAADVSNPAKEWAACKSWSFLIMDEFWAQVHSSRTHKRKKKHKPAI